MPNIDEFAIATVAAPVVWIEIGFVDVQAISKRAPAGKVADATSPRVVSVHRDAVARAPLDRQNHSVVNLIPAGGLSAHRGDALALRLIDEA